MIDTKKTKEKIMIEYLIILLSVLMIVLAIFAIEAKDLLSAVIAAGFISLVASILFLYLHAPDVSMTEAAIGAALTTFIFIVAIKKTERREK